MVEVVRVARRPRCHEREFGGDRLADDDGAGGAQLRHQRGVHAGAAAGVERGAVLGRVVLGVDDVLDADRDAVERPQRAAGPAVRVERIGLRAGMGGVDRGEGVDLALARLDPGKARVGDLARGQGAGSDLPGDFNGGRRAQRP